MKKNLSWQYEQWKHSTKTELWQAYGRYSAKKENAMNWCKEKMQEQGGHDLRILSANTFQFTVGWVYTDANTGKLMFNVETSHNSYEWEVSEK